MAAQALVRPSYADPLGTYATNVMGTANLLQAVRSMPSVRAVIVVTSDKVYDNDGGGRPFKEDDRLGGRDPYSSSKACAELVGALLPRVLFRGPAGRHGACRQRHRRRRLVALPGRARPRRGPEAGRPVALRYPRAVRPWQHVLDPLAGYLMLAQAMVTDPAGAPAALNFGPDSG